MILIVRKTINKIRRLRQGDHPALAYATDFFLLATDIPWDDQALMEKFRYSLHNDVKDLMEQFQYGLLTPDLPEELKLLTKAISRAVLCDNRIFERRSEH